MAGSVTELASVFPRTGPFFDSADIVFVTLEGLVESWLTLSSCSVAAGGCGDDSLEKQAFQRAKRNSREKMRIPSKMRVKVASSPVAMRG